MIVIDNLLAPIYWARCDLCGRSHGSEETAVEPQQAIEAARDDGWMVYPNDVHYCPECASTMEICS